MKLRTFKVIPSLSQSVSRRLLSPTIQVQSKVKLCGRCGGPNDTFFSMALPARSGPRPLIQFRNYSSQTVALLGRVISPSQGLYLNTDNTNTVNAYTHQTSMTWVGFESTIPASERAKTVHALNRAATVTGWTKWHCGRFSPSTLIPPANYSGSCSIIINHPITDTIWSQYWQCH
jgi:hypothetical protein